MSDVSKLKVRITLHHDRKKGVAVHNDRTQCEMPHIDKSRSCDNVYWHFDPNHNFENFEVLERAFYKQYFGDWLDAKNERYEKHRNYDRVRNMDEIYETDRFKPDETILQIGDEKTDVDPAVFEKCIREYMKWEQQWAKDHGLCYVILDWAIHADETSLHCHERGVYLARDKEGNLYPAQDKALEQAGINLPNQNKKRSDKNNRKMVLDELRREVWADIVEEYSDFEVIRTPLKEKQPSKSPEEVKEEKAKAEEEIDSLQIEIENARAVREKLNQEFEDLKSTNEELDEEIQRKRKFSDKIDVHETISDSVDNNKKRSRRDAEEELAGLNAM